MLKEFIRDPPVLEFLKGFWIYLILASKILSGIIGEGGIVEKYSHRFVNPYQVTVPMLMFPLVFLCFLGA